MKKIAIIGAGFGGFIKSILSDSYKVTIYDLDESKTECNYSEIVLNNDNFIVATPNKTHYKIVKDLLTKGKNVLCLKPFVLSTNEVEELFEISRKNKCKLRIGFNNRFRKEVIEAKGRGISSIDLYWRRKIGDQVSNLLDDFMNIKFDIGVHLLDLVLYLGDYSIENKNAIIKSSIANEKQSYSIKSRRINLKCTYSKNKENLFYVKVKDANGNIYKFTEKGNVSNFKDTYTFIAMVNDFMNKKSSDNEEYIKKLTKILCW